MSLPDFRPPRPSRLAAAAQARLVVARARVAELIQPQLDALDRSSRVTATDRAVTIAPRLV